MAELSSNLLLIAFIIYLVATLFFGGAIKQKRGMDESHYKNNITISAKIGITLTIIGFMIHIGYFITRWVAAGHAPVSNMFEFITFFSMMLVGAFILIYIYLPSGSFRGFRTSHRDHFNWICQHVFEGYYSANTTTKKYMVTYTCDDDSSRTSNPIDQFCSWSHLFIKER